MEKKKKLKQDINTPHHAQTLVLLPLVWVYLSLTET